MDPRMDYVIFFLVPWKKEEVGEQEIEFTKVTISQNTGRHTGILLKSPNLARSQNSNDEY